MLIKKKEQMSKYSNILGFVQLKGFHQSKYFFSFKENF